MKKAQLEARLQGLINKIAKAIDKGHECISSGKKLGKYYDAGHYYSVGSNPTLRFHLLNIFGQSIEENRDKSGNPEAYKKRLKELFGDEFYDYIVSLKQIQALHLGEHELKYFIFKAEAIHDWLIEKDAYYEMDERIQLRKELNELLGIYKL